MGLIPMQEPHAAIEELRRCILKLNMTGIMLAGTGLKAYLGSKEYWPIYAEQNGWAARSRSMAAITLVSAWTT